MRVEASEEQEFLRSAVAGVVAREASFARVREWAEANDSEAADAIAVRQGWNGIGVPEEFDGQGGGGMELAIVAEELGKGAVPFDRLLARWIAAPVLDSCERAAEFASANASDGPLAVLADDSGKPVDVETVLETDGTGVYGLIDASIGTRSAATLLLVSNGRLIALDGAGLSVSQVVAVDHTREFARLTFEGATGSIVGRVDADALRRASARAAVIVAADSLGAAQRMLDLTVQYVGERVQFGVPVGSFQAVKHAAAEMLVDVESSRSAVMYAAWALDETSLDEALMQAAIAKSHVCAAAARVADKALFLHGAVGYTWEHDLQFLFKRAKSNALLFGAPSVWQDRIASALAL